MEDDLPDEMDVTFLTTILLGLCSLISKGLSASQQIFYSLEGKKESSPLF